MTDHPSERPGTVHRVKRARIAHVCDECEKVIDSGHPYIYLNTFDEKSNRWGRYILCRSCERWRACHTIAELASGDERGYPVGKLQQEVDRRQKASPEYREAFREAWRAATIAYQKESS